MYMLRTQNKIRTAFALFRVQGVQFPLHKVRKKDERVLAATCSLLKRVAVGTLRVSRVSLVCAN